MPWKTLITARGRRPCALKRAADDADAFAEFYAAYATRVLTFFTRRVLNVEVAMDLTSETFAHALARRQQFRGSTAEQEQAWLFAVARSELSHFWRHGEVERRATQRYALQVPVLADDEVERIEELAGVPELRQHLAAILGSLPDGQRRAIELRVLQELGYDEVAAMLDVSEEVARTRVSRGLRTMAHTLRPAGGEQLA